MCCVWPIGLRDKAEMGRLLDIISLGYYYLDRLGQISCGSFFLLAGLNSVSCLLYGRCLFWAELLPLCEELHRLAKVGLKIIAYL